MPEQQPEWTLAEIADKVRTHLHRGAIEYLAAGEWLCIAKDHRCPPGTWQQWLRTEFRFGERMAEQLMNAHRRFGSDPQRVAGFSLRVLFLLSAPSTPERVVADILAQAEMGARITEALVKGKIGEAKTAEFMKKVARTISSTAPGPVTFSEAKTCSPVYVSGQKPEPQHEPEMRRTGKEDLEHLARRGITLTTYHPFESIAELKLDLLRMRDFIDGVIADIDRVEQSEVTPP